MSATASNSQAPTRIRYLRDAPVRDRCHAWRQGKVRATKTRRYVLAKAGDVLENPVTGERAVIRLETKTAARTEWWETYT
jgi:hypothetical protein